MASIFAVQSVPRDGSRHGHAKHMLRLRRDGGIGKPEAAEVIIVNSHDGTSAYQMFAGMLRFVCTNSMIAGERFEEIRVPHKGGIQDQIIEGVFTVAEDFPRLIDASETMKEITLSADERRVLAEASLVARYGEEESPVRPDQIIEARRREDVGQSLWTTFNVIQENVIRGGLHVLAALSLVALGIFGPGIANGLVSGGPQLGAGAAIGTGLAVGGAAMAVGGGAMMAAKGGSAMLSGGAAAARGGATAAGAASSAYSLGSLGKSGAGGVASGMGAVARTAGSAAVSPLRRAASRASESLKSSFSDGGKAGFGATGGSSTMGTVGGEAAEAASTPAATGGAPDWAKRMKRNQTVSHGVSAAAHAIRSGDSHGSGSSINLSESDR